MEKARVGIFEDSILWQKILPLSIEDAGHIIVANATSLEDAKQLIEELDEGSIDVAVVDGNLSEDDASGNDGELISSLLHEKFASIVVLGFTGGREVRGADSQCGKDAEKVLAAIAAI